ncbi:MAG: toll/interleukin-1 receptor domain-containing protein [Verrucomicrobiota bacterium]
MNSDHNAIPGFAANTGWCSGPQLEDGTNVTAGTSFQEEPGAKVLPWYIPAKAKTAHQWEHNLTKLRSRFERLIDEFCPVECVLLQWRIPMVRSALPKLPIMPQRSRLLWAGSGLSREPAKLLGPDWAPLVAAFPINSVQGNPILSADGRPVAYRFGLHRYHSVYALGDDIRPVPIPQLAELVHEGGDILYQLPPAIATSVWRLWPTGFSQRLCPSQGLWLDMIFELSWQCPRGGPWYTERQARVDNFAAGLLGGGLFPRLPDFLASGPKQVIPHEHGYPATFYSKLADVARASVAAIDEIIERAAIVSGSCETESSPPNRIQATTSGTNVLQRDHVFISYSHKDTKFLDQLLIHLKPLERAGKLTKWSDKQIASGSDWFAEIQESIAYTKVAVLLVSPNFLASDFIHEHEFGPLLLQAEKGGVRILWIPIRASAYEETALKDYQALSSPEQPLAQMKAERDVAWVRICKEIKKAINK